MAMKSKVLVDKAVDIAQHYKTLYVMGCFGAPMTAANKKRYTQNHSYNKAAARVAMINGATADTFGFDCVNLIKGILWGWTGDPARTYGGAAYPTAAALKAGACPDVGADGMIAKCTGVSTTGWASMLPGEAVWLSGHIGIYIGDGLAVECTPKWANKVQITAVGNIGKKAGYNTRTWTKHGRIPWVDYSDQSGAATPPPVQTTPAPATQPKEVKAKGAATGFDKSLAGTYTVTASGGLHIRDGAGTGKASLAVLPNGTKVRNYGYFTETGGVKWLYIQTTINGTTYTGFSSGEYLKKQ